MYYYCLRAERPGGRTSRRAGRTGRRLLLLMFRLVGPRTDQRAGGQWAKQTRRIAGGLAGARADGPASRPVSGPVASGQDTQAEWPASWVAGWLVTRVTAESQSSHSRVTVESDSVVRETTMSVCACADEVESYFSIENIYSLPFSSYKLTPHLNLYAIRKPSIRGQELWLIHHLSIT